MTNRPIVNKLKTFYRTGQTRSLTFRKQALITLRQGLIKHEQVLLHSLKQDLGKGEIETYTSEIGFVHSEINFALKHLKKWMKIKKQPTPLFHLPAKSYIQPESKGVVLIIGPWNYPLGLMLTPLVGALAAGNVALLKPSELAPHAAQATKDMIDDIFPSDFCAIQLGDKKVAADLLSHSWDHIFFTGSTRVGSLVMEAAAKTLSPVTLELGGKSPCIITDDVDLNIAAERIVWGKFINAGQTCVAPDYVFVPEALENKLIDSLIKTIERFYGQDPMQSNDYSRIINLAHFNRLKGYLTDGEIAYGGHVDESSLYIAPTLINCIKSNSPIIKEELFGPLLPIIPYTSLDLLINELSSQSQPLALYIFSSNPGHQKNIMQHIPSGTTAINDTINQIITPHLPLGGLGKSGMGQYHGKASFDCFTHYRSIFKQTSGKTMGLSYPPYKIDLKSLKKFYKWMLG